MSPITLEESGRPGRGAPAVEFGLGRGITANQLTTYVQRGRRLRAEAMARLASRLGAALRDGLRGLVRAAPSRAAGTEDGLAVIASRLKTPLTAIRASAEILRDNPDIDPAERRRFLAAVLAEEARMEALVSALLDASSMERGRPIWRVRLNRLRLEDHERVLCPS